jgi:Zn-dependent protease
MLIMLAMAVINGRFSDPLGWLMNMALMLPAIVIGLSFHEFGHAVVAYRLGDHTPKLQGRVTISPLAHIDPFGFLALMFVGFGWGKPVQINPGNFRHPRRDEFLVGIAGVTINLIIAIATAGILKLYFSVGGRFCQHLYGQRHSGYPGIHHFCQHHSDGFQPDAGSSPGRIWTPDANF